MNDFILEQAETKLRATYLTYDGYVKRGEEVEFIGVTEEEAAAVILDIEGKLDELTLEASKTELLSKLVDGYKTRFEATAPDWRELKYWMKDTNRQRYDAGQDVPGIILEAAAFATVANSADNDFTGAETFIDPATGGVKYFDLTTPAGLAELQGAKFALWVDMEFAQLEADYQAAQTTIRYAVSIDVAQAAYEAFVAKWN